MTHPLIPDKCRLVSRRNRLHLAGRIAEHRHCTRRSREALRAHQAAKTIKRVTIGHKDLLQSSPAPQPSKSRSLLPHGGSFFPPRPPAFQPINPSRPFLGSAFYRASAAPDLRHPLFVATDAPKQAGNVKVEVEIRPMEPGSTTENFHPRDLWPIAALATLRVEPHAAGHRST
jgi:hypothetical protein